ncbi:MAG: endonuclease [Candidatus Thiodiazotropha sp. 6PLUC5]
MNYRIALFFLAIVLTQDVFSVELQNGVPQHNLSAATGDSLDFEITIPSNSSNLNIEIADGYGDADLYVKAGSVPTESDNDCGPYLYGNSEQCLFASPQASTYFVKLQAYQAFSGLTLSAAYATDDSSTSNLLQNNVPIDSLSATTGSETLYQIDIPADATELSINISGGSGDVDLYVSSLQPPTTSIYECRPYLSGNNETCTFTAPATGSYYIMLRAYSSYSDVHLSATYSLSGNNGNTDYPWSGLNTYYADAIGQTGTILFNALAEAAARNHNPMTYSQAWEALKYSDEDPANTNNIILIYTGRSQAKSFNASGNNDPDAWNREHTWPKSHGFPSSSHWAYTDIHQLRPADASVNSTRGNKDYDNGGNMISEAPGNYTDSDSFEPRDEIKGDIARMMFYMDIRYNGNDSTGTGDLTLVDYSGTSGAALGDLCTLYQWHRQDPVSSEEITRHQRIVERQGNRNPFVDNTAWVDSLWGSQCGF